MLFQFIKIKQQYLTLVLLEKIKNIILKLIKIYKMLQKLIYSCILF